MHSLAGTIGQAVGVVLYLTVLVDHYYFLPKRVARWEKSETLEDKKKLDRYKKAVDVFKLRWLMSVLTLVFASWFFYILLSISSS